MDQDIVVNIIDQLNCFDPEFNNSILFHYFSKSDYNQHGTFNHVIVENESEYGNDLTIMYGQRDDARCLELDLDVRN